jgi:hypothetical protein
MISASSKAIATSLTRPRSRKTARPRIRSSSSQDLVSNTATDFFSTGARQTRQLMATSRNRHPRRRADQLRNIRMPLFGHTELANERQHAIVLAIRTSTTMTNCLASASTKSGGYNVASNKVNHHHRPRKRAEGNSSPVAVEKRPSLPSPLEISQRNP